MAHFADFETKSRTSPGTRYPAIYRNLQKELRPLTGQPCAGVMRVVAAVRRLQHGRVQAYLFYLVAGVAALAVVTLLGGAP